MTTNLISRIKRFARGTMVPLIACGGWAGLAMPAAAQTSPLAFTLTITGTDDRPNLEIKNDSRVQLERVHFYIGHNA